MSEQTTTATFEGWAVLELMGHRKLAGFVREEKLAGAGVLRIDVPGKEGNVATQFYSPSAMYALTPVSEDVARRFAERCQPEPVTRWELPPAREPIARATEEADFDDDPGEVDHG